jgi:transposase
MRFIALDVHRDFCEVAIKDASGLRLAGRVKSSPAELELFACSLAPDDRVALEATGPAQAIAGILRPHVERVVIANTRKLRAIAESKVKTDKVDAKTLCELLAAGFLPAVFSPDEFTRALRRRLQRRSKLVRSRTRAKNECHAVLARNLKGRPPMTDIFGKAGRQWLAALELPADESETVQGCLREVDFLDCEVGLIESELASEALGSDEIRRLMTVPGVCRSSRRLPSWPLSAISTASARRRSSSPTSGLIRGCASPARRRRATGTSQSRARPKLATCSARPPGWWSERRARCAPSMSACAAGEERRSRWWQPPES